MGGYQDGMGLLSKRLLNLRQALDELLSGMENQPAGRPLVLKLRNLISHRRQKTIPASARIGEVEDFAVIEVEIRLRSDAKCMVIMRIP